MTEPIILAVDLGTSGMKVALITMSGKVLGWEVEPLQLLLTPDGGAEQSPEEWWGAFLSASKRLLGRNQASVSMIRAVCCSTQGEGTVPVDRDGKALSNCILWMDMRGAAHLKKQLSGLINIDGADLFKVLRFVRLTGGMPNLSGKDPAGHMLYLRNVKPDIYARTHKFLNVLDYMNLRLTGEFTASFDSIVTSWVTDNRDSNQLKYNDSLISTLGLERDKLPDIFPCASVIGILKSEVTK